MMAFLLFLLHIPYMPDGVHTHIPTKKGRNKEKSFPDGIYRVRKVNR